VIVEEEVDVSAPFRVTTQDGVGTFGGEAGRLSGSRCLGRASGDPGVVAWRVSLEAAFSWRELSSDEAFSVGDAAVRPSPAESRYRGQLQGSRRSKAGLLDRGNRL
jgi:hypothetical protein